MKEIINPFVTNGYAGPEYFCDRIQETADLLQMIRNGNNVALISPRRIGKTDLLHHCFSQPEIKDKYHCFVIDIYNTCSIRELVNTLGMSILNELRPKGRAVWDAFISILTSVRQEISFDINGMPVWSVGIGNMKNPEATLDEIFRYIDQSDRHCFIAIDEFQQITRYGKDEAWKAEASLRTYIQRTTNATFIFSGSHRHIMSQMFLSPSRPFYQQTQIMGLKPIDRNIYNDFATEKFLQAGKHLAPGVVDMLYEEFDSITAYIQRVMNILYDLTPAGETCQVPMIRQAIDKLLNMSSDAYASLLYQMPEKQRQVLIAIAAEGKASGVSGGAFIRKYKLPSASSVVSAIKGLLEKDFITEDKGQYWVYDKLFVHWLRRNMNQQ